MPQSLRPWWEVPQVDLISWRTIFFINVVPLVAIWPVLLKVRHEDTAATEAGPIDFLGAALAIIGLGGPVYALIEQGNLGWQNPQVWLPMAVGLLALATFLIHERRTPAPMLPLSLFRIRNFGWGNLATTAIYAAFTYGFFVLGIYLQQVAGMSATVAGILLLPSTVILMVASTYFGGLAGKYGARWFMTAGPALCAVGFLLMLAVREPLDYASQVLPGLLVFGLGLAVTVAPLTSAILGAVPTELAGIGSAINNAVARVAGLVCIAFAGIIMGSELTTPGLHRGIVVVGVLLMIGAAASAVGIRNPPLVEDPTAEGTEQVNPPA